MLVVKKKGHRANSSEVKQREKDSLIDLRIAAIYRKWGEFKRRLEAINACNDVSVIEARKCQKSGRALVVQLR